MPSTYFHRRMAHLTALRVFRLGAWSAVMLAHHKDRATTSEGPARPPEGSLFAAAGGRMRRLTMSRERLGEASGGARVAGATLPTRWPRKTIICIILL